VKGFKGPHALHPLSNYLFGTTEFHTPPLSECMTSMQGVLYDVSPFFVPPKSLTSSRSSYFPLRSFPLVKERNRRLCLGGRFLDPSRCFSLNIYFSSTFCCRVSLKYTILLRFSSAPSSDIPPRVRMRLTLSETLKHLLLTRTRLSFREVVRFFFFNRDSPSTSPPSLSKKMRLPLPC